MDAIVLEMASLKLSHDASMLEYVEACLLAMLSFVPTPSTHHTPSPASLPSPELLTLRREAFTAPPSPPSWPSCRLSSGGLLCCRSSVGTGLSRWCSLMGW